MRINVIKGFARHIGLYLDSKDINISLPEETLPRQMERWNAGFKYGKHRSRFGSAQEFMEWYNNRLHGALRLEWDERPCEAFVRS